jgi:hypothetical protein
MDTIPPDVARKLLNRDFANLVKRVQNGGKLNRSERAMLQGMAASAGNSPTVAENFVELAKILGVSRRALQNWRKRQDAPQAAANGFHEVAAWREFMERNGLEGETATTDEETALRARKLLAEVEERELRLAVKKGEYVALEEVRAVWTEQVAKAKELLRHKFEMELPPVLSGLDTVAIQQECARALDEVFTLLHASGGGVAAAQP